jgi:cytosine permease
MSVGVGEADIVAVMVNLGFPVWGFLVLWFATWTSQLVNNYSMGLAFSNLLNVNTNRGRQILTFLGTLIAIGVALAGILDYFEDFLYMTALVYPAIAGILFADFFFLRNQTWKNVESWNFMATIAIIIGIVVGYLTQYVYSWGLPAVQSLVAAMIAYYLLMRLKAKIKPDDFTPEKWL